MTTPLPAAAQAWLDRLTQLAEALPPARRSELVADLREHLATALGADSSDAHVRQVLDDIGSPESVVAEAGADLPPAPVVVEAPSRWYGRPGVAEGVALVMLVAWGILLIFPPIGLIALITGLVFLWISRLWNLTDKIVGTVVALVPVVIGIGGLVAFSMEPAPVDDVGAGAAGTDSAWAATGTGIMLLASGLIVILGAIWLGVRLRRAQQR